MNPPFVSAMAGRVSLLRPVEFAVSLGLLAPMAALVVMALLLEGNSPKAMRVGLAAATYLTGLLSWGLTYGHTRNGGARVPAWPFIASGGAAGLVSGLVRSDPRLAVVAVQVTGGGLLLGGFHWFAVRVWRHVYQRIVA